LHTILSPCAKVIKKRFYSNTMKILLLLIIVITLIFVFYSCFTSRETAETKYWKAYYAEQITPGNRVVSAKPDAILEKTKEGDFIEKKFFYDTKALVSLAYLNSNLESDGKTVTWTRTGIKTFEGTFKKGLQHGESKRYNLKTGLIDSEMTFKKGKRVGLSKYYNSEKGYLSQTSDWVDGEMEGVSTTFNEDGSIKSTNLYKNDECIDCPKQDMTKYVEHPPAFPCDAAYKEQNRECAEKSLLTFLNKTIVYPSEMMKVEVKGKVIASFIIDKDGSVTDIDFHHGVCYAFENEVKRVLMLMPKWIPGEQNGHCVKVRYSIPINFNLE
jgi:antitoxin component YwqK of YwqJK toxin-antitoxin module